MKHLTSILIITFLIAIALTLRDDQEVHTEPLDLPTFDLIQTDQKETGPASIETIKEDDKALSWLLQTRQQIQSALDKSDFDLALDVFDQAYDRASRTELASLNAVILAHAALLAGDAKPEAVIQLLEPFAQAYNDLDAWRMLVSALAQTEQWPALLIALKKTNRLENDNERYAANLKAMVRTASALSTEFERSNDRIAILNLYQQLYEEYPQYPRFQLDLARAHLALNSEEQARPLLQALVYDPSFGSLASQQLDLLNEERTADLARLNREMELAKNDAGQIVVPLIRAGTSLLIDARIEGIASRLLLDTGASITALSIDQIEGLGLQSTGQTMRLNTANGFTTSRLFRARSLAIGGLVFENIIVAEIDFGGNGLIDGLLGTDVLRQMGDQYSYLIDDQNNALIFRPR